MILRARRDRYVRVLRWLRGELPCRIIAAMNANTDDELTPAITWKQLTALKEDFGFEDSHLQQLHHNGEEARLQDHMDYLDESKTNRYDQARPNNLIVAKRVNYIANKINNPKDLDKLIMEAKNKFPF